ncbi:MAG: low molecular weight protein-tyrosine-phosphatase [Balneolaceae bacterium]
MRSITREDPFNIVFVCLGNICRSPTAEGVFQHLVNSRGLAPYFYVDSAGTSAYHIGESANSNSQKTANRHGMQLKSRARQFDPDDLEKFDLILAMDNENKRNIEALDPDNKFTDKIKMMREYDPEPGNGNVPDPYYGGAEGFERVFDVVKRSCENLLDELEENIDR